MNNVNIIACGPDNKPIPNLICASGKDIPVPGGTAKKLYNENAPAFPTEFARVVDKGGFFSLFHPEGYAIDQGIHKQVVEATGLTYSRSMSKKHKLPGRPGTGILTAFQRP